MKNQTPTPEQFRVIDGYQGRYIISNYGYVISHSKYMMTRNDGKPRILKGGTSNQGYPFVTLGEKGENGIYKVKVINIHKLVVKYFIEHSEEYNVVNHIDGNKMNAHVDNLQPCTQKQNIMDAYKTNLRHKHDTSPRKVLLYDPIDDITYTANSMHQAAEMIGVKVASIYNCCTGRMKSAKGFKISYAETIERIK